MILFYSLSFLHTQEIHTSKHIGRGILGLSSPVGATLFFLCFLSIGCGSLRYLPTSFSYANPPRNTSLAPCWVFYAWGSHVVGAQLLRKNRRRHTTTGYTALILRTSPVSNESLGINRERVMDCQSGREWSRVALEDDRSLKKRNQIWVKRSGTVGQSRQACPRVSDREGRNQS